MTTLHVEASLVGHDLTRGTSRFTKAQRPERAEQDDVESELTEMIHESLDESGPVDSWGEPRPAPATSDLEPAGAGPAPF